MLSTGPMPSKHEVVSEEVNIAALFTKWVEKSCASLTASSLLPFDSEQGQQVKSPV